MLHHGKGNIYVEKAVIDKKIIDDAVAFVT